jgi:eukaryotic-like serine/threonine-protein kinase
MNHDPTMPARLGDYEIRERLGRGPYCTVWRASRVGDATEYALKVLDPRYAADEHRLARFQEEASLALSFAHPNIVRVHRVLGDGESPPFFVMDLLPGGNLGQFRGLPVTEFGTLLRLLAEVSGALDYLHRRGLVHCDLKPSNVLLDAGQRPFLTDFGMTASPDDIEQSGSHGGTILYMSPEQFESFSSGQATGHRVDARSDVYSLGVLLYELFTGQMPFTGGSRYALMYKRLTSAPTPPSRVRAGIAPALEQVILKAMASDPADRFPTAAELATALELQVTAGE